MSPEMIAVVRWVLSNGTTIIADAEQVFSGDAEAIAVLEEVKKVLPFFQMIFAAKASAKNPSA